MRRASNSNEAILKDLRAARARFTSLEAMAETLRSHPGFQDLNRGTLSRWLSKPSPRARVAVQILKSRQPPAVLRIGENKTLSVIPSSMLQWPVKKGTPHGLLSGLYKMKPEVHATPHGNGSFDLLVKGETDVALLPGDLLSQLPSFCARVCLLSKVYIAGIAVKPVTSVFDLKGRCFGVLAGSSFMTRLKFESRNWGFELPPALVLPSAQDCVQALLDGTIDCLAGWEPFVSHAQRDVERRRFLHVIPHGVLGWFEMHVAVNLKTAHPGAVRAYLSGLQESVRYINGRKSVASFHGEIGARYSMAPAEVRHILANITYEMRDLDPVTLLKLWEREATLASSQLAAYSS